MGEKNGILIISLTPGPGVISWLHSVRIGSNTMIETTHCSATSPSTLIASSQEAEGGLFPYPIQPFRHHIRVFSITYSLFYGLKQSSGSRRVGTTVQRDVLSIREWNGRLGSRRRNLSGPLYPFSS